MKIIGKTENGYIIESSKADLERLEDLYYSRGNYRIGTIIKVHEMYDQVKFLLEHKAEIAMVQKNLQRINDNLTLLQPFVAPEEQEKEEES